MFESSLLEVYQELERQTEKAVVDVGLFVKGQARLRAPVDLGNLKGGIDYIHEIKGDENFVIIGSSADYSIYVEKGTGIHAEDGNGRNEGWSYQDYNGEWHYTKGQKPQPFLRPAIENNLNVINKIIEKHLGRE